MAKSAVATFDLIKISINYKKEFINKHLKQYDTKDLIRLQICIRIYC